MQDTRFRYPTSPLPPPYEQQHYQQYQSEPLITQEQGYILYAIAAILILSGLYLALT